MRAAAQALWTAGLAAPPLREGLTPRSVARALPYLLALLEAPAVALSGPDGRVLGADGRGGHHADEVTDAVTVALRSDRRQLAKCSPCDVPGCSVSRAVISPLIADGRAVDALVVLTGPAVGPYLVRATDETARFICTQLELADLDESRATWQGRRSGRCERRSPRISPTSH